MAAEEEEGARAAAPEGGGEGEDPEVEYYEDWGEEDDGSGFGNPLGFWEGDSFRLEQFPAEPSSWQEGDVEVAQTMGTLDLIYYFSAEESVHLTPEDLTVEVAGWRTRVTLPGKYAGGGKRAELGPLTGGVLHALRPKFTVWRLLEENGQKCLHLHLAKLEHRPWKNLWATGSGSLVHHQGKKGRFPWQVNQREQSSAHDHQQLISIPHEKPPPRIETDYRLDAAALCVGLDDVEELDEHAVLRVHFDRRELERLETVVPLEDVLTADVQERHLRIFLRVTGEEDGQAQLAVFEGDLRGRCVPELTAWQLVRAAKGDPKGGPTGKGEAFNPALEVMLAKHPDEQQERWGQLFGQRMHAEELAMEKANSKGREYRLCEARLRAREEELLGALGGRVPPVVPRWAAEPPPPAAAPPPSALPPQQPAPARAAPPAAGAAGAVAEGGAMREFLIDNSELQANTQGLGYRLSKHLYDKDGMALAEWGTTVLGVDQGDGWVKVGHRYLPTKLNGKAVLTGDVIGLPRPEDSANA